ncbi:MAG: ribonucleotide-diphosphate reductase subunit beta, partial [Thermoproteota archaeon]|nr:ribonucleotide-diphosphate reductase subunit beta [Thermoproteota archaeon]
MKDKTFFLIVLELGTIVFDSKKNVMCFIKYDNPLRSFNNLKSSKYEEITECLKVFDKNNKEDLKIFTNHNSVRQFLKDNEFISELVSYEQERDIQINKIQLYLKTEKFDNQTEIIDQLRDFSFNLSSTKVQEASEQLDLHISQSINSMDEIDKILNTIGTRMREWYGLHFPELDNLLQSIVTYATIVFECGKRENITRELLEKMDIPENRLEIILNTSRRSRGGKITDENLQIVQNLAQQVLSLSKIRKVLENHIDNAMEEVAPNVKNLLTAAVGARLIAKSGSLKKLASSSASTIQILGAEKALFRTLKTGANPPKHGILFQQPIIHSAPKWQRGKLARAIASKTAIAARLDIYGQTLTINQKLSDTLNSRITEIQEKYKEQPPIQKSSQNQNKERRDRQFGGSQGRYKDRDFKNKKKKFRKRHHKSNKK